MRKEGWESRLFDEIEKHADTPFEYGKSDCIIFAIDCVRAITGKDLMEGKRNYSTLEEAKKVLVKTGHKDLGDVLAEHFEEIPPAYAHRGDVGVIKGDGFSVAVVFVGPTAFGKDQPKGLMQVSRMIVERAFRV